MTNPSQTEKAINLMIGRRIKQVREDHGVSQTDLGITLGTSFQQVQKYENGINRISGAKLFMVAREFNKNMEWFCT